MTNREWASLIWIAGALALWYVKTPGARGAVGAVLGSLWHRAIMVVLVLYAAWIIAVVAAAAHLGIWTPSLAKDTFLWAIPGLGLLFGAVAGKERHFLRRRLVEAIGLTALVEFYLNWATFDLWVELIIQPVLLIVVLAPLVAAPDEQSRPTLWVFGAVRASLILALFVPPTMRVVSALGTVDLPDLLREATLPVWLTAIAIPFVYGVALVVEYDTHFGRLTWASDGHGLPWRTKLAIVEQHNVHLGSLREFGRHLPWHLARARSFAEARRVLADKAAERRRVEETERRAAEDLHRYAGVKGTDPRGRQLDRREFAETIDALETLVSGQVGWYERAKRYRRDLVERFGDVFARGLPQAHDVVIEVSRSGQSWYAWRKTPSGWCFAVGAAGAPPTTAWYFDGPDPPTDFPGRGRGWADITERSANWEHAAAPEPPN